MAPAGFLIVLSAPSGTGKSTVARRLVADHEDLEFSVSFTTRAPRRGEVDGRDYHFVDRARFEAMAEGGELLEWAEVFGHLYGTGVRATRLACDNGRHVLLDIDVEGARQVRSRGLDGTSILLLPPDYATLARRLEGRGSEGDSQRTDRLGRARREIADHHAAFDYVVVNDELEQAVRDVEAILRAETCRSGRRRDEVYEILDTFPGRE